MWMIQYIGDIQVHETMLSRKVCWKFVRNGDAERLVQPFPRKAQERVDIFGSILRNTKQYFENLNFIFVSDFVLRISDFVHCCFELTKH